MRSLIRYSVVLVGLVLVAAAFAELPPIYKYIDQQGNITYSELPPPGLEDVEIVDVQPGPPPAQVESAQERMQRMEEMSSELEASRKEREDERVEESRISPSQSPQTAEYDDREAGRYPYYVPPWYVWPRPPIWRPKPPGFRPHPPGQRPKPPGFRPHPPGERPRPPGLKPRPPGHRPGIETPIGRPGH